MGKTVHDDVLDGALNIIKNNCAKQTACSSEPTTYTQSITTYMLAEVTMASGDFTAADGDTSGRKLTTAAKSGVTITNSGTATHIAQVDVTNSKLLGVTTCTPLALTAGGGNTVNFPAWKREIADPA
jgi:hypothetical protein